MHPKHQPVASQTQPDQECDVTVKPQPISYQTQLLYHKVFCPLVESMLPT
jgi:hypothetical protein